MSWKGYLHDARTPSRLPRYNEGIWSVILDLDAAGPWTVRDIWRRMNTNIGTIHKYLRRLRRGGYAIEAGFRLTNGKNPQRAPLLRLAKRPPEAPRLWPDGSEQPEPVVETLWRTIKMTKTFTAPELADLAKANVNTARTYCDDLTRAGVLARSKGADRWSRYRLIRVTGAKAPRVLDDKSVFDPNSNTLLCEAPVRRAKP